MISITLCFFCIIKVKLILADGETDNCVHLQSPAMKQNIHFPLSFCHWYPGKRCCLPVHDEEISKHYYDLIDAGSNCEKHSSRAKDYLKAIFCISCGAEQPQVTGFPNHRRFYLNNTLVLRVCKRVSDEVAPIEFSSCGMTKVKERGMPCKGDDTVIPHLYWPDCNDGEYVCQDQLSSEWSCSSKPCGLNKPAGLSDLPCSETHHNCDGIFKFLNDNQAGKPPYMEGFPIEIINKTECIQAHGANSSQCACVNFGSSASRAFMSWRQNIITFILLTLLTR